MHARVNGEPLNPGGYEETTRVVAYDLQLEHAVHKGDPVVDPG